MTEDLTIIAIRGNLEAFNALSQEAASRAQEAVVYIAAGKQDAAIGTVAGLEQNLARAQKLLGAALTQERLRQHARV